MQPVSDDDRETNYSPAHSVDSGFNSVRDFNYTTDKNIPISPRTALKNSLQTFLNTISLAVSFSE